MNGRAIIKQHGQILFFRIVVREAGLEPARQRRQDLNLVRLPISPLALPEGKSNSIGNR